jgi:hypothetical protein
MVKGKLVNMEQTYSVEIEIDDATNELLEQTSDGDSVDIDITVRKCDAMAPPNVAIRTPYENLEIQGADHDVNSIQKFLNGKIEVVPTGTVLKLNATVRAEKGGSAVFQD